MVYFTGSIWMGSVNRLSRRVLVEITDVHITRTAADGKLLAYVTVTFDRCFVVHNIKIILGRTGPFVAMPSRKTKSGLYRDIAHPITSAFRDLLQSRILEAYEGSVPASTASAAP